MNCDCKKQIEHLRELLELLDEKVQLQLAARKEALDLQAAEYERRLDALNGEQSRLSGERQHFVTRELHDVQIESIRNEQNKIMATMSTRGGLLTGMGWVWSGGIAVLSVILASFAVFKTF